MGLPSEAVGVGHQAVAQLQVAPAYRLDLGAVGPGEPVAPGPPVGSEHRAEGAELEPAGEELAAPRARGVVAADVRAPVGHAGEADGDLGLEGREGAVDVAGPACSAEALHAGAARAADEEGAALGPVPRLG